MKAFACDAHESTQQIIEFTHLIRKPTQTTYSWIFPKMDRKSKKKKSKQTLDEN